MTDPFLFQVFCSLVLILIVCSGFKVDSRFWVSGSITALVVEDLGRDCRLTGSILGRIGQLNNL